MGDYIVMGIVGILILVMSVLPKTVYNGITYTFSMHKYGIRKIQRYRTTTDTLANCIIGVLVVFSIFLLFHSILFRSIYDSIYIELFVPACTSESCYVKKDTTSRSNCDFIE